MHGRPSGLQKLNATPDADYSQIYPTTDASGRFGPTHTPEHHEDGGLFFPDMTQMKDKKRYWKDRSNSPPIIVNIDRDLQQEYLQRISPSLPGDQPKQLGVGTNFCTQCGHSLTDDGKFCGHCGKPAPTPDDDDIMDMS